MIPLLCALTCGELSVGPAAAWGRGVPEHDVSTDVRWRVNDAAWSPYVEVLAGRVSTVTVGGEQRFNFGRVYFGSGAGVAVHFGDGRTDFGSVGLFHLSGSVGYRVTSHAAVELSVEHWSNAHLAKPDRGLNAVVGRLVWRY